MTTPTDITTAEVKVYAWCFEAFRMIDDLTGANHATSNLICEAQLTLMELESELSAQRYDTLTAMIAKSIDAWRNAENWGDRTTAADLVIRAYWEVSAARYPDLPHALPVQASQ
jgi:hypothetical protein